MNFESLFTAYWKQHLSFIEPKGSFLIAAVSGGADSVVLASLLHQLKFSFAIAHANFQLRGSDSTADEALAESLAAQMGVAFFSKKFDTMKSMSECRMSVQEAARKLRYDWFHELATEEMPLRYGSDKSYWILTAHHAADNRETVLMNIFRGTGFDGLRGMAPRNGKLIRPMLFAEKDQILAYAQEKNLKWNEDASNKDDKYTRNFFRLEVIPKIKTVFPQVENTLLNNMANWRNASEFLQAATDTAKQKLLTKKGSDYFLAVRALQSLPGFRHLLFEIASDFNFAPAQLPDVLHILNALPGKYVQSPTHRIINNRKHLVITPVQQAASEFILIEKADGQLEFGGGKLKLRRAKADVVSITADPATAMLDLDKIRFPLTLRKWKEGDYFYPLGMQKKKKLSRFFISEKLSLPEKENIWVLLSDQKIIWVVGKRIDNRLKLVPATKNVLKIKFLPPKN